MLSSSLALSLLLKKLSPFPYFCALFMAKINLKQRGVDFIKTLFPSTYWELGVFLFFISVYGLLGTYIATNYRIIFDNRIPWDAYFSFDNRSIIMTGGGFERHPLSNYFFDWLRNFALWISDGKKDENFRLVLAWCSNLMVSITMVQLYKYLRNIIRLNIGICLLLVVFFSLFSTSILLSFTPETYTYTLFLLVLFNYYAALKLRKDGKIAGSALTLFGIGIGGLTITNIVKIYIPILFEKNLFWNWKKIGNAFLRVLVSLVSFVLLYLYRLNFNYQLIFSKTEEQYEKFSQLKTTPVWDMIYSWFFGGTMLFPSFFTLDYHNKKGFEYKALFMDTYSCIASYIFVGIIAGLLIWSAYKNRKNKLALILLISFSVDVIIHCVLKFGLQTSYIYGGHYIFVVPMLLGWLFHQYRKSINTKNFLVGIMVCLTLFLAFNNTYRMSEFFEFLNLYYR